MELTAKNHTGDNFNDIGLLRSEFQMENTSRRSGNSDYYSWKIKKNPFKEGICKVVQIENKTVSMTTITPKKFLMINEEMICAEIGDTFTSTDYQRRGLFTRLVNSARDEAEKHGINFIYGTPNTNSLPGYQKKLNFGIIPNLQVYNFVYPINMTKILDKKINNVFISSILSSTISPFFKIKKMISIPDIDKKIQVFPFTESENYIDEIWEEEGSKYDCITIRNSEYIKWRYLENPDNYNFLLATKHEKPVGYIVLKDGLWNSLRVGYIADIFTVDEGDQIVFNSLIEYARKYFINKGFDMISMWIQKGVYTNRLKSFGFRQYKSIPVICYNNDLGDRIISKNLRWYFTMSDSDNI